MKRAIVVLVAGSLGLSACVAKQPKVKNPAWFAEGADEVELSGTVEVPLYRSPRSGGVPTVLVELPKVEEDGSVEFLAALSMVNHTTIVREFADLVGLEVKKKGQTEYTVIPEVHVGEVVFHDVRAEIQDIGGNAGLTLGIAHLGDIGLAVLPSAGVVRFADAASAPALLSEVGEGVAVTRWSDTHYWEHGTRRPVIPNMPSIPGRIGQVEGQVHLGTDFPGSVLSRLPEGDYKRVQGYAIALQDLSLAGLDLGEELFYVYESNPTPHDEIGAIGYSALYRYDIAWDGTSDQIAFREVESLSWTDPDELHVEWAREEFEEAVAKAEESEGTEEAQPEATEGPDRGEPDVVARHQELAGTLWLAGFEEEALEHYAKAADAAGESCEPYLTLGRHLVYAGQLDAAVEPLTMASESWLKWYSQDLKLRNEISEIQKEKPKKKEKELAKLPEGAYTLEQPPVCHEAHALLARAFVGLGRPEAVEPLYSAHHEFDPDLSFHQGVALLARGDAQAANGPLRRAIRMGYDDSTRVRVALGMASDAEVAGDVVPRQFDRAQRAWMAWSMNDLIAATELARREGGADAAARVAQGFVDQNPKLVTARLVQAYLWKTNGQDEALQQALPEIRQRLDEVHYAYAAPRVVDSWRAIERALADDTEGARAALERAAEGAGRQHGDYWLATVLVPYLAGDAEAANAQVAALRKQVPHLPVLLSWDESTF